MSEQDNSNNPDGVIKPKSPEPKPEQPASAGEAVNVKQQPADASSSVDPAPGVTSPEPTDAQVGATPESDTVQTEPEVELKPEVVALDSTIGKERWLTKKKAIIIAAVVAALLILFGAYWFVLRDSGSEQVATEEVEQIVAVGVGVGDFQGDVEYTNDEGQLWQELTEEAELNETSWLRTGGEDGSRVEITFDDGSRLRLDKNSEVQLTSSTSALISASIEEGRAYARVASSDSREFVVVTDKLSAKALGTAYVTSTSTGRDGVEVYVGSVSEDETDTRLGAGQSLSFEKATNTPQTSELSIEQIKTDEFILWNRNLDLEDPNFARDMGILEDIASPDLNVTSPVNGAQIEIPIGSNSTTVDISGTSEPNAQISIKGSDSSSQEVTADDAGAFSVTMNGSEGEVTYVITSTDKNGNESVISVSVTFVPEEEDNEPPIVIGAVAQPQTGVVVNWTFAEDFEAPDGVRVLWNRNGNLEYPVEAAFYEDEENSVAVSRGRAQISLAQSVCSSPIFGSASVTEGSSYTVCRFDAASYAFRVCRYDSATDSCDVYSNELRVTAPGGSD